MPVSAVASSPVDVSSLAAQVSPGSSGITADLSTFTQAQSSGNTSCADAALVQLKSDLASEQISMLSGMMGSPDGSSDPPVSGTGNSLLSTVLSLSSNSNISSALGDVQNLAAQSTGSLSSSAASASSASAAGTSTSST